MAFKPNRDLLNANFEGYKLAEVSLPFTSQSFVGGVNKLVLSEDQFSYQHVRQATMYNHLVFDPWNGFQVYWFTAQTRSVLCGTLMVSLIKCSCSYIRDRKSSGELVISTVYQCQELIDKETKQNMSNTSLIFLSHTNSLLYDVKCTQGQILLFDTKNRTGNSTLPSLWQVISTIPLLSPNITIQTAFLNENHLVLNLMTYQLERTSRHTRGEDDNNTCTCTWLNITFAKPLGSENIGEVNQTLFCKFESSTVPLYSEFIGHHLMIVSDSKIKITSHQRIEELNEEEMEDVERERQQSDDDITEYVGLGYGDQSEKKYEWVQTETDVNVSVSLSEDIAKRDIHCIIERDNLVVGLTDGTTYIRGELWNKVDPDVSHWVMEKGRLEVSLEKLHVGQLWPSLLNDVPRGKQTLPLEEGLSYNDELTPEELKLIEERLLGVSEIKRKREVLADGATSSKFSKPLVQTTLEECDTEDDKDICLFLISQDGNIIERMGLGGKQLLFTLPSSLNHTSLLSIRHDIDALLYSPFLSSTNSLNFAHVSTFHALGYVQASKRDKKFLTCSPNMSYAALSTASRHIFVYCQPTDGIKGTSAVQYVHTLGSNDGILGLQASSEQLVFVLCENELIALKLDQ